MTLKPRLGSLKVIENYVIQSVSPSPMTSY